MAGNLSSLLLRGTRREATCVRNVIETMIEAGLIGTRFGVTTFILIVTGIIRTLLTAFLVLRWTKIIVFADAQDPVRVLANRSDSFLIIS